MVVVLGQMFFGTTGVLLAGQNLRTAVSAGFSLTQIGEFSYIIGSLGLALGVIESSLYQVIVSVSVVTIFLTPFVMKLADPAGRFLERVLPERWQNALNKDTSGARPLNQNDLWRRFLQNMLTRSLIYYILCITVIFFSLRYGYPLVGDYLPGLKGQLLAAAVILVLVAPFLQLIIVSQDRSEEFRQLWRANKAYRAPLVSTVVLRVLLCTCLIMYVLLHIFDTHWMVAFASALAILLMFLASRHLRHQTMKIEQRFKTNLNEKEQYERAQKPVTEGFTNHLLERDLHLSEFRIFPYYEIVGKTLADLAFRQTYGVDIVTIVRNGMRINVPNGDERIFPNDQLIVLGTDAQMEHFRLRLEEKKRKYMDYKDTPGGKVCLRQIEVEPNTFFEGKNIRSARIQEAFDCLVVGIERNGCSLQNPPLDLAFEAGDVLWLVGEDERINQLKSASL
jgi:CPA2 family monovalent cation:H+ antiporter-2